METWRRNLTDARTKMQKAHLLQKRYFDCNRKEIEFSLGDRLLVSKKHLTLPVDRDLPWKLRSLWDGPYKVIKVLKDEQEKAFAYQLELPVHVKREGLHDVFTVNKLVKYRGDTPWPSQQMTIPEPEIVEGKREFYVDRILRHRDVAQRGRPKQGQPKQTRREYLVTWQGMPEGEAQWRPVEKLNTGGGYLGAWKDYEKALLNQDPQLASKARGRQLPTSRHVDKSG
eukprot:3935788-Pyramimonas_sp.AAC.1